MTSVRYRIIKQGSRYKLQAKYPPFRWLCPWLEIWQYASLEEAKEAIQQMQGHEAGGIVLFDTAKDTV